MAEFNQKTITGDMLADFSENFGNVPEYIIAQSAIANAELNKVAINRSRLAQINHTYSHKLDDWEVTNQQKSGRCWLFAGTNVLRYEAMKKMNVKKFELSQAYLFFWDKLEKANYFLENVLETLDEEVTSRLFMWLLQSPVQDGGQWDMFVNLVQKYGVVPKEAYPESANTNPSAYMNQTVTRKLREYASILRKMNKDGKTMDDLRKAKAEMLNEIYRILCIMLGEPPKSFTWDFRNEEKEYHRDANITPQEFYAKYVGIDLDDYVCLINAPTSDKPYNKMFTVKYLNNVKNGRDVMYLNIESAKIQELASKQIVDEEAVWFGCDVGKFMERERGILDLDIYNYDLLFDTKFGMDKATRLDYGESVMTHAMVFTGVNMVEGKPESWRVENSWSDKTGDKGFYVMSAAWFDEFMYEVVVNKKYLTDEMLKTLEEPPIVLPPWDPMGSLA